jgi:hypothetical protein
LVKALEACSSLEVDLDTVESPPWIGDNMENVNTRMTAIPKGTTTARINAEMKQEDGLEKYVRVYTDGSLIEASEVTNVQTEQLRTHSNKKKQQESKSANWTTTVGLKKNSKVNAKTTAEQLWKHDMVATKPDVNRYRNTEDMHRRHQVIISRLRMG